MILKGSQRGGAAQLARHLLKTTEAALRMLGRQAGRRRATLGADKGYDAADSPPPSVP